MKKLPTMMMFAAALIAGTIANAKAETVAIHNNAEVPIGAWVVTSRARPLCTTAAAADNYISLTLSRGISAPPLDLPAGCVVLPIGTEVQIVKQDADQHACVTPRGQTECRWGGAYDLATKDDWAHDKLNPDSDTTKNAKRKRHDACIRAVAILDKEPGVTRYEGLGPFQVDHPSYTSKQFAPDDGPTTISVDCDPVELSVRGRNSPSFISFTARLAHDVTGVDEAKAKEAALHCSNDALWNNRDIGDRVLIPSTLYVGCHVWRDGSVRFDVSAGLDQLFKE